MIDGLKPFPKMKDSGVPWLGEVPEHWRTLPLKRWVRMNRTVLPESTPPEYEFRYLDIGSVGTGVLTDTPQRVRFAAAPSRARRVVRDGDTIVSTVRTYLRSVYFVARDSEELVCSTGFAVLTPLTGTVPKFVSYLCQSGAFTDRVTADSVGIAYPAIAETRLGAFHVAVPPLPEQAAIVRFLDHADRRIRRYIRAKQKLIKLLEEQKQAIIHRGVTRGLDPNVRLKPSGVEWLGDVPEHWQVKRLRHISPRITVGLVINPSTYLIEESTPGSVPMLLGNNVIPGGLKLDHVRRISPISNEILRASRLNAGDVLVVRVGAPGVAAVVPSELDQCNCASMMIVRRDRSFSSEWMVHAFNSPALRSQVDVVKYGAAQKQFNISHAVNFWFPVPPKEEQEFIVEHLRDSIAVPNRAIEDAQREIDLLREYRTRLIADVVTGKLDVREAAAQLPEEAEEPEPLDDIEAEGEATEAGADDTEEVPEEAGA